MSIADAYERLGRERYKTLNGFIAALRAEKLTRLTLDSEEATSERAVCELFRRRAERKKEADRERKKPHKKKDRKIFTGIPSRKKWKSGREKRKSNR